MRYAALYVRDLARARAFFIWYFGAKPTETYCNPNTGLRTCFLTFDGGARLELMTRADLQDASKPPFRTGYAHLAFSAGSKEAVDRLSALLAQDGYTIASGPRVTGDGYYECCVLDGENNQIEITV